MADSKNHRTTSRVLDVIESIAQSTEAQATLPMLSKQLKAPRSSLYPILQTLVQRGYLNYDENSYTYTIGSKSYEIGMFYVANGGMDNDINQILTNITEKCQETSHLAELNGPEVFYLSKKDSPQSIRMFSSPGKRLPAYSTALGKALLSDKTPDELAALYPNGLYAVTEHTITSMDALQKQLKEIHKTGYAFEVEESTQYIRCIAVPIYDDKKIRYAISVAVPVFRYTEEKEQQIKKLLLDARTELEKKLSMAH